jgi:hypothetical protein
VIGWPRETWAELIYLQRRLMELQMQAAFLHVPPQLSEREELKRVYALPAREPDHGLG